MGLLPKHATSPKDLGTYSPREILMRKPISAHECLLPCACFGFASLTNTGNKSPPQGREVTLRPLEGSAPSGKPTPSTRPKSRQAKSSARAPQEFFSLSRAPVVPRAGFFSLALHGLLVRQRGALEHRDSRALTSLSLKHPPALPSQALAYRSGGVIALRDGS